MFWLKPILKLIKFLQSNDSPWQMSWGLGLGMLLGFIPGFNLFHFSLMVIVYLSKINVGAMFLGWILFKPLAYLFAYAFHSLGGYFLDLPLLFSLWTYLYNIPILPYFRFNNTVVLGGLLSGLVIMPFFVWGSNKLVILYRDKYRDAVNEKLAKLKVVKVLKSSKLVKVYLSFQKIKDKL